MPLPVRDVLGQPIYGLDDTRFVRRIEWAGEVRDTNKIRIYASRATASRVHGDALDLVLWADESGRTETDAEATAAWRAAFKDVGALRVPAENKPAPQPIAMRIPCPSCGTLHIDEGEFATRPHHTHACQHCGLTWRPAVEHTVGVKFLPGFKNETSQETPLKPAVHSWLIGATPQTPCTGCPQCRP